MDSYKSANSRKDIGEITRDRKRERKRDHQIKNISEMQQSIENWLGSRGLSKSRNDGILKVPKFVEPTHYQHHGPFVRKVQDQPPPPRLPLLPISIRAWFSFWFSNLGMPCFRPPPQDGGDWSKDLIQAADGHCPGTRNQRGQAKRHKATSQAQSPPPAGNPTPSPSAPGAASLEVKACRKKKTK